MTIHIHSDGTADDDPDCPAMTEDRVPTTEERAAALGRRLEHDRLHNYHRHGDCPYCYPEQPAPALDKDRLARLRASTEATPPTLDVERLARAIQADIARRRPLDSGQPLTAWSEVMRTAIFIRDHYEGDGR